MRDLSKKRTVTKKPKILISYTVRTVNYVPAVQNCGGIPIIATPGEEIPECDGLLLIGGADIHPKYYGEEIDGSVGIDDVRDKFEFALIEEYAKKKKPILGICRGIQLMNAYFGGTLHQDLGSAAPYHRTPATEGAVHGMRAEKGSILYGLYGEEFAVNSFHHQAVKALAKDFFATAISSDGIIEGIQHESLPFFGVQWHPERMCFVHRREDTADGAEIFRSFVRMCIDSRDGK